jgi:universal stress protein family protein
VVRPVTHHDVDGLAALYATLDDDARYRRFFAIYRPDRDLFERITIEERGVAGARLLGDPVKLETILVAIDGSEGAERAAAWAANLAQTTTAEVVAVRARGWL